MYWNVGKRKEKRNKKRIIPKSQIRASIIERHDKSNQKVKSIDNSGWL
jgi:hypothetical protein